MQSFLGFRFRSVFVVSDDARVQVTFSWVYRTLFLTQVQITFRMPSVPLLSQPEDVPESWFCNRDTIVNMSHCLDDLCRCVHRLHVKTGQVGHSVVRLSLSACLFPSELSLC